MECFSMVGSGMVLCGAMALGVLRVKTTACYPILASMAFMGPRFLCLTFD